MDKRKDHLFALIFDDPYKAEEARAAIHRMEGEGLGEITETAIIVRKADGKTRISQDMDVQAKGQKVGQMLGLATAAITGTLPFVGVGMLAGRLVGKLTDHGVTNAFLKQVSHELQPGTSALILLAHSDDTHREKVVERLRPFQPKVLKTGLPPELLAEIETELQRQEASA